MDCFNRFILKLLITGSLKAYMLTKSGLEFNQQNKTVGTSSDARPWPIVSTLAAAKKKKSMVKHPRLSTAMRVEGASSFSSYSRSDSEPHHRKAWCPWQNAEASQPTESLMHFPMIFRATKSGCCSLSSWWIHGGSWLEVKTIMEFPYDRDYTPEKLWWLWKIPTIWVDVSPIKRLGNFPTSYLLPGRHSWKVQPTK